MYHNIVLTNDGLDSYLQPLETIEFLTSYQGDEA